MQVHRYNMELAQIMCTFGAFEEAEVMIGRVNIFRHSPHVRSSLAAKTVYTGGI